MNYRYKCKKFKSKHLKENTEDLYDIKIDKYFLNQTQKTLTKKDKTDKMELLFM